MINEADLLIQVSTSFTLTETKQKQVKQSHNHVTHFSKRPQTFQIVTVYVEKNLVGPA